MIDEREWTRADAYLAGECSPAEAAEFERRLALEPELRDLVAGLRRGTATDLQPDEDRAWERVRVRALAPAASTLRFPVWRRLPPLGSPAWRVAAGLVLVAAGAVAWRLTHGLRTAGEAVTFQQIETRAGQTLTATLPDGSRVQLAPESRLRFATGLLGKTRTIGLEGEAYFSVAHDAARPFVVRSRLAVARDLGTQFLVSARSDDALPRVVVAEGRVLFRAAGASDGAGAVLAHGDLGRIAADGRVDVRHGVDLARELDWTRGQLVFEGAPVADAFARLEHWYGVRLVVADSVLASRRFTGTVQIQPLPELLQALALALDARYERQGARFLLHAQSTPAPGAD
jgi:ferric-dicitrate binding protein FerR (iron transport regulator)